MKLTKLSKYNLSLLFTVLSLVAISIGFYAVNIFFVLIPFLEKNQTLIKIPNIKIVRYSFFYFLIIGIFGFIFYCFNFYQNSTLPLRQLISFTLFMSIYVLSLYPKLNFDKNFIFKALFISSLVNFLFSLWMIKTNGIDIFSLSAESSSTFKRVLSQHSTGHVFSFAFIASLFDYKFFKNAFYQSFFVIISILGIVLTFSRSSFLSLAFGLCSYLIMLLIDVLSKKKINLVFLNEKYNLLPNKFFKVIVPFSFLTAAAIKLFEIIFQNFYLIFNILNSIGLSERVRIERWLYAWDYAIMNPFNGSSFLGVWGIHDVYGSLHSSFFDVLFRTGIIGFILYFGLIVDLIIYYFLKKEYILVSGIFCLIGYGISYEALLWPSGLCLIAILLSMRCRSSNSYQ